MSESGPQRGPRRKETATIAETRYYIIAVSIIAVNIRKKVKPGVLPLLDTMKKNEVPEKQRKLQGR